MENTGKRLLPPGLFPSEKEEDKTAERQSGDCLSC